MGVSQLRPSRLGRRPQDRQLVVHKLGRERYSLGLFDPLRLLARLLELTALFRCVLGRVDQFLDRCDRLRGVGERGGGL